MMNKRNWLGMLVVALVFGMTVVGCGDWVSYIEITNETVFPVTKVELQGTMSFPDTSGMNPNSTKIYDVRADGSGTLKLTVNVGTEDKTVTSSITVPNEKGSTLRYVLSGNSTNLQLTKK
jgi:LEA14-like dessication related protein